MEGGKTILKICRRFCRSKFNFSCRVLPLLLPQQNRRREVVRKGADMEREKKREYMERLTRELMAYDSEAVGEAVKCRLSRAAPDRGKK